MMDRTCNNCLFTEPDKRCEHYVERIVGECKGDHLIKVMKIDGKKHKVTEDTVFPMKVPDVLASDVEHLARCHERVRMEMTNNQQILDGTERHPKKQILVGYVKKTDGLLKKPVLYRKKSSKKPVMLQVENIVRIEWMKRKTGRKKVFWEVTSINYPLTEEVKGNISVLTTDRPIF